jgi:phosphatidylcholine synthase
VRENAAPPAAHGAPRVAEHAVAPQDFPLPLRLAGAAVHLYTASGSVLALLIVIAAIDGRAVTALWLGLAALVIDGTDGMLARRMRVKETIPWFDGARLDDIVDYLTYVFAPIVLLWMTGRLPEGPLGWLLAALPLLASSFQFCRVDAKTSDHFFLGFPSYWNIVAFYVIVLDLGPTTAGVILLACSVLVFVPVRYVYPSRTRAFQKLTLALTALWLATYAVLLLQLPDPHPAVVAVSLGYLGYYVALSAYLTAAGARRRRTGSNSDSDSGPNSGSDSASDKTR